MRPSDITRLALIAAFAVPLPKATPAQPPQSFETAVIRSTQTAANAGTSVELFPGGRIKIVNEPIKLLIRMAFQLQNAQIAGGPDWLETGRYDIEAKTGLPEKIKPDQIGPLLQSLLAERFSLKFHRETRELPVYALIIAQDGPKLKPKAEGESSASNTTGGANASHSTATAASMELLAGYFGNLFGRIVLDKTGLTGDYDFKLDWSPDEGPASTLPSLVTALREQLGAPARAAKESRVRAVDRPFGEAVGQLTA